MKIPRDHLLSFAVAALLGTPLAGAADPGTCPPGGTTLRWESFARPLLEARCNGCHDWTNYTFVYVSREPIRSMVDNGWMPPGDPLPSTDLDPLDEWLACDLPLDGPACPPGGAALGWTTFAAGFFADDCGRCHSSTLSGADRNGAPDGRNWDDLPTVRSFAGPIRDRVARIQMPPDGSAPWPDIDRLLLWLACGAPENPAGDPFSRADPNGDGTTDLSDAVVILGGLFQGTGELECLDAADADGSGALDLTDAVRILEFLFQGGEPPPPPFLSCGESLVLGCATFAACR
jgi:hypothetical protein